MLIKLLSVVHNLKKYLSITGCFQFHQILTLKKNRSVEINIDTIF